MVRHIGRERVPSELRNQSPSTLPKNFAFKQQNVNNRDSASAAANNETVNSTVNETYMEMSIHEVKKITEMKWTQLREEQLSKWNPPSHCTATFQTKPKHVT